MRFRVLPVAILLFGYLAGVAAQNVQVLRPVDEAPQNPDFLAFRTRLKEIVSKHVTVDSVSSTRAGKIPGTHRVGFDGPADQILLEHTARSREGFAFGAIIAAEWIVGKTGFYEFTDVIAEIIDSPQSHKGH